MKPPHIHILGICGTFMAGIATIARALGHQVSGSDAQAYPPMSDVLASQGIEISRGYEPAHITSDVDCVVIGNALSRGNKAVEHVLNARLRYISGPQWLAENVLHSRHVLAVSGTHGKTTVSSMLAWILEHAGYQPGFLIGGLPANFTASARLGSDPYFVIEADEYDTAFFDKRSKFVHYLARTLVINNVEYDHADIFPDMASIYRQFHHLVRTVPGAGTIVRPADDAHIDAILAMGVWSNVETIGGRNTPLRAVLQSPDGSHFDLINAEGRWPVKWSQFGAHNVANGLAAIAAAMDIGIKPADAARALTSFEGVARRLQVRGEGRSVTVYDDFAHHPTAISATIDALRARIPSDHRLIAVVEPRSNTMRLGAHGDSLGHSLAEADKIFALGTNDMRSSLRDALSSVAAKTEILDSVDAIVGSVAKASRPHDHVLVMSNGSFGGLHEKLLAALRTERQDDHQV
ncbi:MAG: UDP-N-acetylmuramate:L-alanyl-gamma-D-glutamyl-meso-diaminopimelate ligase [Gammaproteobacteria bacterium]|nr:UDP-N-acetylmuramate:L-alanyl-gamma-D-glutamyl-meso-diaminopimelate ligase [Gammaproteobacteria bacterium]